MRKLLYGLIIILLWAGMFFCLNLKPVEAAQISATITPIVTVTPVLPVNIPQQLSINWTVGAMVQIDGATYKCQKTLSTYNSQTPLVVQLSRTNNTPFSSLCLQGFRPGQPLNIRLINKLGIISSTYSLQTNNDANDTGIYPIQLTTKEQNPPNLGYMMPIGPGGNDWISELVLYLPPGMPSEIWNVEVSSGSLIAKGSLNVAWPGNFPAIFIQETTFNPFDRSWYLMPQDFPVTSIQAGETIQLSGVNLPPSKNISLALYAPNRNDPKKVEFLRSTRVLTDAIGNFTTPYKTQITDTIDRFYLVAIINPEGKVPGTSYLDGAGPYLGIHHWATYPCADSPITYSYIGRVVKTDPRMGFSLYVREEPGMLALAIGKLSKNVKASIVEGPRCSNNMVWWKVNFDNPGANPVEKISGWVAEGPGTFRWLVLYDD